MAAQAWIDPPRDSWTGARFWPDLDADEEPEMALFEVGHVSWISATDVTPTSEEVWGELFGGMPLEPCGDLDGDGAADLCSGTSQHPGVVAWLSSSGPPDLERPDRVSPEEWRYERNVFGLTGPDGIGVPVLTFDDETTDATGLATFSPDLSSFTVTYGPRVPIAVGDFLAGTGTEVFLSGDGLLGGALYSVGDVGLVATGTVVDALAPGESVVSKFDGAAGDFDGDGAVDFAVAGPSAVWVYRGPFEPGHREVFDADLRLPLDELHFASVAADDIDGDGRADLLVGQPSDDTLATDGGAVHLWHGSTLFP